MTTSKTPVALATEGISDVTVYIGRFRPFHLGHAHVLERALKSSQLVIVLIGSAFRARSPKNPFTYEECRGMIYAWAKTLNLAGRLDRLEVRALRDRPYNNTLWIKSVQDEVADAIAMYNKHSPWMDLKTVRITGSDRDDSTWYLKAFPQWPRDLVDPFISHDSEEMSATSVRDFLYNSTWFSPETFNLLDRKLPPTTRDFLTKFVQTAEFAQLRAEHQHNIKYMKNWEKAPYPVNFCTSDAIVIQSGHILVVQRGAMPGEGLWALPGGHLGTRERFIDGAIRELLEETGVRLVDGKNALDITKQLLVKAFVKAKTFDNPNRSECGRRITVAHVFKLDDTKPLPFVKGQNAPLEETGGVIMVETRKAWWMPLAEALGNPTMWFEDHHDIIEDMVGSMNEV